MSFFKFSPKKSNISVESVDEALNRGVKVVKCKEGLSRYSKRTPKIDAQALLNAAIGTPQEQEVIAFLKSQGIEVQ
jgi:hypothetical protein